jgi:hypothetical protein
MQQYSQKSNKTVKRSQNRVVKEYLVYFPGKLLPSCVVLGRSLDFSEAYFPPSVGRKREEGREVGVVGRSNGDEWIHM